MKADVEMGREGGLLVNEMKAVVLMGKVGKVA